MPNCTCSRDIKVALCVSYDHVKLVMAFSRGDQDPKAPECIKAHIKGSRVLRTVLSGQGTAVVRTSAWLERVIISTWLWSPSCWIVGGRGLFNCSPFGTITHRNPGIGFGYDETQSVLIWLCGALLGVYLQMLSGPWLCFVLFFKGLHFLLRLSG